MIIEILEGVSFEQSKTVLRDYPQVDAPTLSTCFLLLTEPSLEYQSREDLLEELRTLLAHPGIFTL